MNTTTQNNARNRRAEVEEVASAQLDRKRKATDDFDATTLHKARTYPKTALNPLAPTTDPASAARTVSIAPAVAAAVAREKSIRKRCFLFLCRAVPNNVLCRHRESIATVLEGFPRASDKKTEIYQGLATTPNGLTTFAAMQKRLIAFWSKDNRSCMYGSQQEPTPPLSCPDLMALMTEFGLREGVADVVSLLRHQNMSLNDVNKRGQTALMLAARGRKDGVVRALIAERADVNIRDMYDTTALMNAVAHGTNASVDALIAAGANIDPQNSCGRTALKIAAYDGHEEKVRLLINGKADVNSCDGVGASPLVSALHRRHGSIVKSLVEAKADLYTVLAVWPNSEVVMRVLLAANADLCSSSNGLTPLMRAIQEENWELSHLLASPLVVGLQLLPDGTYGRDPATVEDLLPSLPALPERYVDSGREHHVQKVKSRTRKNTNPRRRHVRDSEMLEEGRKSGYRMGSWSWGKYLVGQGYDPSEFRHYMY